MRYFTVGYIADFDDYVGDVYQEPTTEFECLMFMGMPSISGIVEQIAGERSYNSIQITSITEWNHEDWLKLQE